MKKSGIRINNAPIVGPSNGSSYHQHHYHQSQNKPSAVPFKASTAPMLKHKSMKPKHVLQTVDLPLNKKAKFRHFITPSWNGFGYCVKKSDIKDIEYFKETLTARPRANKMYGDEDPDPYPLYHENEEYLVVPRLYGTNEFGPCELKEPLQNMKSTIEFLGTPLGAKPDDPPQIKSINTVLEQFGKEHLCIPDPNQMKKMVQTKLIPSLEKSFKVPSCLMCLPCGFGKTFCALYIAWKMKVKTMVYVHRDNLQEVWVEDIETFMPKARIGFVCGDIVDVKNKDIIIVSIQSVMIENKYPFDIFSDIGLSVIDEAHHSIAKAFCRIFDKIQSKYILALSATPKNKAGLGHLLNMFLGPIVVSEKRKKDSVLCTFCSYKQCDKKVIYNRKTGKENLAGMITRICNDKRRNEAMAELVSNLILHPAPNPARRKVLFISERGYDKHLREYALISIENFKKNYSKINKDKGIPIFSVKVLQFLNSVKKSSAVFDTIDKMTKNCIVTLYAQFKDENEKKEIFKLGFIVGGSKRRKAKPKESMEEEEENEEIDNEEEEEETEKEENPMVAPKKSSKVRMQIANECDLILSNFQTIEEGFNCPRIDTIFISVSGRVDLEQTAGRGLRYHPEKNIPHIIEFYDDFSKFSDYVGMHRQYFSSMDYQILNI